MESRLRSLKFDENDKVSVFVLVLAIQNIYIYCAKRLHSIFVILYRFCFIFYTHTYITIL